MGSATLRVGIVYRDWQGEDAHALCLDTTGDVPGFFIDAVREFVPLNQYLRRHPDRRPDVLAVLRERLA